MSERACPFCTASADQVLVAEERAFAFRDGYPVSLGHTLIVPRRHVGSWFELTDDERAAMLRLLAVTRELLIAAHHPDGFNFGINDGVAAGQTVPHVHLHVIPRYHGDLPDPRGGVRWVIPDKAAYWTEAK